MTWNQNQNMNSKIEILDLEKMAGWHTYQERIRKEIEMEWENLRGIKIEGRTREDIASDYITIIQKINGLKRALEIPEEIKEGR